MIDVDELKIKAEQGDPESLFQLGLMYYKGDVIECHITNALNCWKKLADSQDHYWAIRACRQLSAYYFQDDIKVAWSWINREFNLGSDEGGLFVATQLFNDDRFDDGLFILRNLAMAGSMNAKALFVHGYEEAIEKQFSLSDEQIAYMRELQNSGTNAQSSNSSYSRSNTTYSKLKHYFIIVVAIAIVLSLLWVWICPCVIIVDDNKIHTKEYTFFDIEYVTQSGDKIVVSGHKPFNNYVFNVSNKILSLYETIYTYDNTEVKDFKPECVYIEKDTLTEIKSIPDFYFNEPSTIEISENFIFSLYHNIFGGKEVRWVLDYNEWSQEDIAKIEEEFIESHQLNGDEYTDGRIIFKKPRSFYCNKVLSPDSVNYYHTLESENVFITIVSDYWTGKIPTSAEFLNLMSGWKDTQLDKYKVGETELEKKIDGDITLYSKKYFYEGEANLTWKILQVTNAEYGKTVVVSSYISNQSDDCIDEFIGSIRYN